MASESRLSGDGMDHDSIMPIKTMPLKRPVSTIPAKSHITTTSVSGGNYVPHEPVKGAIKKISSHTNQKELINIKGDSIIVSRKKSDGENLLKYKESDTMKNDKNILHKSFTEPDSLGRSSDSNYKNEAYKLSNENLVKTVDEAYFNLNSAGGSLTIQTDSIKPLMPNEPNIIEKNIQKMSIVDREVEGQSSPDVDRLQCEITNLRAKLDHQIQVLNFKVIYLTIIIL